MLAQGFQSDAKSIMNLDSGFLSNSLLYIPKTLDIKTGIY